MSAVQKAWGEALGTDAAPEAEEVMNRAHGLLQADSSEDLARLLDGRSCADYLGAEWIRAHPSVWPALRAFEHIAFDGDAARFSTV
ncbi:MAG: hypothetical protein ACTHOH_01645 [Lysobacteraceae bacterium]